MYNDPATRMVIGSAAEPPNVSPRSMETLG
jgi:hypothetical protein